MTDEIYPSHGALGCEQEHDLSGIGVSLSSRLTSLKYDLDRTIRNNTGIEANLQDRINIVNSIKVNLKQAKKSRDIDLMISESRKMQKKTFNRTKRWLYREAVKKGNLQLKSVKDSISSVKSRIALDDGEDSKETIDTYNESFEILPVDLTLRDVSHSKSQRVYHMHFNIGEHILRPDKGGLQLSNDQIRRTSEKDKAFVKAFFDRGIKRKSFNFALSVSVAEDGRVGPISIKSTFSDPFNYKSKGVYLNREGYDKFTEDFEGKNETQTTDTDYYLHPHVRGGCQAIRRDSGFDGSGCLGSYESHIRSAIENKNPQMLGSLLIKYFQSCDLLDSWGIHALSLFNEDDLIPDDGVEVEQEKPIWNPMFIFNDNTISFLDIPPDFEYKFVVKGKNSRDLEYSYESDTFSTSECVDNDIKLKPDPDSILSLVTVITEDGESFSVKLRR